MSTLAKLLVTLSNGSSTSTFSDMARVVTKQTYELGRFALVIRLTDDSALFVQCVDGALVYTSADDFEETNALVDAMLDKLSYDELVELLDSMVAGIGVDAIIEILNSTRN